MLSTIDQVIVLHISDDGILISPEQEDTVGRRGYKSFVGAPDLTGGTRGVAPGTYPAVETARLSVEAERPAASTVVIR